MLTDAYNDGMLWIDCETTGTRDDDILLEVGMQATDMYGNHIMNPMDTVLTRTADELAIMDRRTRNLHEKNGLLTECLDTDKSISIDEASDRLQSYVDNARSLFDVIYMAGFTVSFDRMMIMKTMPAVLAGMQHRMIDITTLNVLAEHLKPELYENAPVFKTDHRALTCIRGEIDRYHYYRSALFA